VTVADPLRPRVPHRGAEVDEEFVDKANVLVDKPTDDAVENVVHGITGDDSSRGSKSRSRSALNTARKRTK